MIAYAPYTARLFLGIAGATLIIGAACAFAGSGAAQTGVMTPRTVSHGSYSALTEPRSYVIRDAETWQALWLRLQLSRGNPAPAPPIDFNDEIVIGAALGERPSGGYIVTVERVIDAGVVLLVEIVETVPGLDCWVVQTLTQPYHFVRVPRVVSMPVEFIVRTESGCE